MTSSAPASHPEPKSMPWYLWLGALAMTSAAIGEEWDASWHRSIGRDTFFTPAHMMIYLCGIFAAIAGVWLIVECTGDRNPVLRAASVRIFGLRAPIGVFVAGWGGLAMLTAGPFDWWWHQAYGLDVQLVSPPHVLLVLGIRVVDLGILLLAVAAMNRNVGDPELFQNRQRLVLYLGGLIITGQMFFMQGYTRDIMMHRPSTYEALALSVPMALAAIHVASRYRWSATLAAVFYTLLIVVEIQLLPLFPAHPRLGPVFTQVTHMVPQKFPPLILAPAIVLDLLWQHTRTWKLWQTALVSGLVFVAVLLAVQWPFASLLMTHLGHSRLFGTIYFPFDARPDFPDEMRHLVTPMHGWPLLRGLLLASIYAAASTWAGLAFGRWMKTVQR
jgi:hypothetical protein